MTDTRSQPALAVGDVVTWTHASRRRRTIGMRLCTGTITAIQGTIATVKPDGHRRPVFVHLNQLERVRHRGRRAGQGGSDEPSVD